MTKYVKLPYEPPTLNREAVKHGIIPYVLHIMKEKPLEISYRYAMPECTISSSTRNPSCALAGKKDTATTRCGASRILKERISSSHPEVVAHERARLVGALTKSRVQHVQRHLVALLRARNGD
jgi:hypothetical protein